MGISTSAATAIILVGLFVAVGVLVPGTLNAHDRIAAAQQDQRTLDNDRNDGEIAIRSVTQDDDALTIEVANEGRTVIDVTASTVVVDNAVHPPDRIEVAGSDRTEVWLPDEIANFTVGVAGGDTIVVVTETGVSDSEKIGGGG